MVKKYWDRTSVAFFVGGLFEKSHPHAPFLPSEFFVGKLFEKSSPTPPQKLLSHGCKRSCLSVRVILSIALAAILGPLTQNGFYICFIHGKVRKIGIYRCLISTNK